MANFLYDAYTILGKVYQQKTYVKQAINGTNLNPQQKAITIKMVYGVLENDRYLEHLITQAAAKPPKIAVKIILKQAIYLIKFTNKPPYTVTNEAVDLVKKLGKGGVAGFVNAVLRKVLTLSDNLPKDEVEALSIKYSYPKDFLKLLINSYGKDTASQIISYKTDLMCLRLNPKKPPYAIDNLIKTPFENTFFVKGFELEQGFDFGYYTVQSIGSVAICDIIKPCQNFLDACAAPGGKCVNLALKCQSVTAFELHEHRVELIKSYAARMGVENVKPLIKDSQIFESEYSQCFDGVLCDVPCSSFGVAHENPDIKLWRTVQTLQSLNKTQLGILSNCAKYVKIGGYLYYSTCSVFEQENDQIIQKFLKNNNNFEVCHINSPLLSIKTKFGLQFLPHISSGAGFYICALKRVV